MGKSKQIRKFANLTVCLSAIALITACGGGSGGAEPQNQSVSTLPVVTTGNTPPSADPTFVPVPGDGFPVADDPNGNSGDGFINDQWLYMQTCLQVSAQEPTVTVVDGKITPTDPSDDAIRHIDGQIVASSHVTDVDASIQILNDDLDGSLDGNPGSYLRSIIGRYLWLANNLAERDYPHDCAKGE